LSIKIPRKFQLFFAVHRFAHPMRRERVRTGKLHVRSYNIDQSRVSCDMAGVDMKAVVFDRFGPPAEVLQVRNGDCPEPGAGQVRVRMIASPINPSDLLVVRGEYGRLPSLPATPGFEGVGVVEAAGKGLLGRLRAGKRVAVLNGQGGTWAERVIVSARQVVPIAPAVSDDQAASFFVNPASAIIMTEYVLKVPINAWLLQTAAGSALGRMVIRLGKHRGFRTISVVRRRDQAEELLRGGADAVICSSDGSLETRVKEITGGAGVRFAIDAVGGATAAAVVRSLAPGGRLVLYGTLSGEPLTIDPRTLMVADGRVEGFWLSNWVGRQSTLTMLGLFRRINRLLGAKVLSSETAASFPLEEVRAAVKLAETPARSGKVLLRMAGSSS
jgi:NADPH:quinone reductase-like Zn-dependent oxidoreductase